MGKRGFKVYLNCFLERYGCHFMPDKPYLQLLGWCRVGNGFNISKPRTFNEKLNWLKVYDRNPEYTVMVDKYAAKKYVADRIGEEYIIPTLGVWDQFDDIDFDQLPDQFVLKCTHDSGGLVICRDKNKLDKEEAKKKIDKSLQRNFFLLHREWPYKDVPRRIIAEKYMEDWDSTEEESPAGLTDYKIYCFNGMPRFLYVSAGLEDHATAQISFLTMDWQFAPYERSDFRPFTQLPKKPGRFDEMITLARKLSENVPFLRVDFYEINGSVYFSELTFSPCAGFMPFKDPAHDVEIGNMLVLPERK